VDVSEGVHQVITQAIAIANGKGGVGKTSVVANLAGLIAGADYRVLAVDFDPQGNLGRDLGYRQRGQSDGGQSLLNAVLTGSPVTPLVDVRPNLDVVPGGPALEDLAAVLEGRKGRGDSASHLALHNALAPLASNYHLILIDTPPGERQLQLLALAAAHYTVIPTKSDSASVDGLERIAAIFSRVRDGDTHMRPVNPHLTLLGIVVFGVGSRSRAIRRTTREEVVRELGDDNLVFDAMIRHVEAPARESRRQGLLAHELEAATGRKVVDEGADPHSNATGLASDYERLATELIRRYRDHAQAAAPTATAEVGS
jgi:chromosome partitioning protein